MRSRGEGAELIFSGKRDPTTTAELAPLRPLHGEAERRSEPIAAAWGTALSMEVSPRFRLCRLRGSRRESFLRCTAPLAHWAVRAAVTSGIASVENSSNDHQVSWKLCAVAPLECWLNPSFRAGFFVGLEYLVWLNLSLVVEILCWKEDGNASFEVHHNASGQPF